MAKPDYNEGSKQINLVIVSDRLLVREGIMYLLSGEDDIKVVDRISNGFELAASLSKLSPDIVIIDDFIKSMNGLEAVRLINQKTADAKVLLLIRDYDEDKELTALKIGIAGFLIENSAKADFIRCIRGVSEGKMWIRREIMEKYIKRQLSAKTPQEENHSSPSIPYFTKRELEVGMLVSKGYKNKQIGTMLFITEATVKHYLSRIFKKLSIRKRSGIKGMIC